MKKLLYTSPAHDWNEALPLGNGFMGAMCFGGNIVDRFQLNADSLWYGDFKDRVNPDAKENIPKIRELISAGRIREAEQLANLAMAGVPDYQCHYEPLCDLFIIPESTENVILYGLRDGWSNQIYDMLPCEGYRRELDIMNGVHSVSYEISGKNYQRESFISFPDKVFAIRCYGTPILAIIERGMYLEKLCKLDENTLCIEGKVGADGVTYCFAVRAVSGSLGIVGRTLRCDGNCVLIASTETSFYSKNPLETVISRLDNAEKLGYEKLKERHIADFFELMNRCTLEISGKDNDDTPTNERLERVKLSATDIGLVNLSFAYGRYLLISSSRKGSLPANLQGIWNDSLSAMYRLFYFFFCIRILFVLLSQFFPNI